MRTVYAVLLSVIIQSVFSDKCPFQAYGCTRYIDGDAGQGKKKNKVFTNPPQSTQTKQQQNKVYNTMTIVSFVSQSNK